MSESLTGAPTGEATAAEGSTPTGTENVAENATQAASVDPVQEPAATPTGSWQDLLPESVREWDEVKNSDSPDKFFDQVAHMRSMMGKSVRIPTPDAGEEAMQAFKEKLMEVDGVMASPQTPEEWTDLMGNLDPAAQKAAYDMLKANPELTTPDIERMERELDQKMQEGVDALKEEWGNAFERKMDSAKNAVKFLDEQMGDNRLTNALEATGADRNPDMIAVFVKIAEVLGEAPTISGEEMNQFALSKSEAKERIAEIEANPAYWDATNPEQKILIGKRSKLYEVVYPNRN